MVNVCQTTGSLLGTGSFWLDTGIALIIFIVGFIAGYFSVKSFIKKKNQLELGTQEHQESMGTKKEKPKRKRSSKNKSDLESMESNREPSASSADSSDLSLKEQDAPKLDVDSSKEAILDHNQSHTDSPAMEEEKPITSSSSTS